MKKLMLWIVALLPMFLTGCNVGGARTETVVPSPSPVQPTPAITASISPQPSTTGTPLPQSFQPVVYYHFVATASDAIPTGSVVILPDVLVLAPTQSDFTHSPDTATNLGSALQAMMHDARNAWKSADLSITGITFGQGAANVTLQGEVNAPGDVVFIAARMQIVMTVFADASVQTATILLNGQNIANLGISDSSEAKPPDFAYTRAEIDTFMAQNAYKAP
jgi:hypothetical protein